MQYQQIIDETKQEIQKVLDFFKNELAKIHSGRITPALVEDVMADCFGSQMPIKQLGAISSLSQRELQIQAWDKSYVEGIVKAIENAGLILSVRIDEVNIYLTAPPLTAESRQSLVHVLDKKKEEIFQQIRKIRDKAWNDMQNGFKAGEIREDDKFKGRDKLDELTRDMREKAEEMAENKEKEIKG